MTPPTTKSELTRNILALQAMDAALWYLPRIREEHEPQSIFWLYGGLCVFYTKPFKCSNGYDKLDPSEVIPDTLKQCHTNLINYRDQVIVHSDSNHNSIDTLINRVYLRVSSRGVATEGRYPYPNESGLVNIESLLNHVRDTLRTVTIPVLEPTNKVLFPHGAKLGLYRLGVDDTSCDWLEPIPNDGLDS